MSKFPELDTGQYAVLCAEVETGIVLSTAGARALGDAERYRTFATAEEAHAFGEGVVAANPQWECAVFNHGGVLVETYRNAAERIPAGPAQRPHPR